MAPMTKIAVSVSIALLLLCAPPTECASSTGELPASDARIRYLGRVDHSDPTAPAMSWVMTGMQVTVSGGGSLSGKFSAPKQGARLRVSVDGKIAGFVKVTDSGPDGVKSDGNVRASMIEYKLVSSLQAGTHVVEVLKVTEDNTDSISTETKTAAWRTRRLDKKQAKGIMSFGGFTLSGAGTFGSRPPAQGRRLEFIGDSDTAGWCADGSPKGGDDATKYQDAWDTWAQHIARNVSADVMVEAISGYGVESSTPAVQPVMDYTLGFDQSQKWNYSSWTPDAVVLLIGPNDEMYLKGKAQGGGGFIKSYLQLMNQVANNYRDAAIPPKLVHVCGGSLNGLDPCEDIQTANNQFNGGPDIYAPNSTSPPGYACKLNLNYEGETTCYDGKCPQANVASLDSCADACDAQPGCTVIIYNNKKECYLKSDYTTSSKDDPSLHTVSCEKTSNPNPGNKMRGYYTTITKEHWKMINGKNGKTEYNGCDGHYNFKGHGVLAGDIIPQFRKIMGW